MLLSRSVVLIFGFLLCVSCSKKQPNIKNNISSFNGYHINGFLQLPIKKVYLNKLKKDSIYKFDSAVVINHQFEFKGSVKSPQWAFLSFKNFNGNCSFILENSPILMNFNNNLSEPKISQSKLNNELSDYRLQSKSIFKKIDYLYTQFQKARLENDLKKLQLIQQKMDTITSEFQLFQYEYIKKNNQSIFAAILLNNILKSSKIDTLKVKNFYNSFPDKVKNSKDGKEISHWIASN